MTRAPRTHARTASNRLARRGFSLIELMIAMALGLVLIGGSITIFSANVRSAELSQSIASLQAGARFAIEMMSADVRSAGYRGCAAPESSILNVSVEGASGDLFRDAVLGGSVVASTGWTPPPPGDYVPLAASGTERKPGTPIDDTHALNVQYAAAPGRLVSQSMSSPTAALSLAGSDPGLQENGFALISDCQSADVFRIDTLGGSATAQTVQPDKRLSKRYLHRTEYPKSTQVFPLVGAIYYIGDTGRDNLAGDPVHALFLQSLPFHAGDNPPIELLEGVDQLQLRFGVVDVNERMRFLNPDDAGLAPDAVQVLKIGLLMSSVEPLLDAASTRVFRLAGHTIGPGSATSVAGQASYPADRRLRVPYGTTLRLRNRS